MSPPTTEPLIVLASKSPRRRYLLEQAGLKFLVIPSRIDESKIPLCSPETYVRILSEAKADDISKKYPEFGFENHKGYPTKAHKDAIRSHGVSPIHRMSFKGVKEFAQ